MSRFIESLRNAPVGQMQTQMYLVQADRPNSGDRIDALIEATSPSCAKELHKHHFGGYDADPDYDENDVMAMELPRQVGDLCVHPIDL
jgi:hypothetical protein